MSASATELFWPAARLDEALEGAARHANLRVAPVPAGRGRGIEAAATGLGVEAEPLDVAYADLEASLASRLPALVDVGAEHPSGPGEYAAVVARARAAARID